MPLFCSTVFPFPHSDLSHLLTNQSLVYFILSTCLITQSHYCLSFIKISHSTILIIIIHTFCRSFTQTITLRFMQILRSSVTCSLNGDLLLFLISLYHLSHSFTFFSIISHPHLYLSHSFTSSHSLPPSQSLAHTH